MCCHSLGLVETEKHRQVQEFMQAQMTFGTKMQKSLVHVAGTYIPGYGRMFQEERSGKFQEGRLLRAMTDQGALVVKSTRLMKNLLELLQVLHLSTSTQELTFEFQGGEYLPT